MTGADGALETTPVTTGRPNAQTKACARPDQLTKPPVLVMECSGKGHPPDDELTSMNGLRTSRDRSEDNGEARGLIIIAQVSYRLPAGSGRTVIRRSFGALVRVTSIDIHEASKESSSIKLAELAQPLQLCRLHRSSSLPLLPVSCWPPAWLASAKHDLHILAASSSHSQVSFGGDLDLGCSSSQCAPKEGSQQVSVGRSSKGEPIK